jgi:O-succinylhomoserine sulfhydrylase
MIQPIIMSDKKNFETEAIRGQLPRTEYREHSVPMFLTSSFTFSDAEQMRAMFAGEIEGDLYSRYSNPNTEEFIQKVCQMEKAEDGIATASGMAAIFASIAPFVSAGDHILACRAVFGSTHQILTQILPKWGVTSDYVESTDIKNWHKFLKPTTKMLVLESPSNPGLELVDLEKAGQFCKKHNLIFNIDNCFATPYIQQPTQYGADLVVHSATKFMDGQGRVLGGIVVGHADLVETIRFFIRHTGPSMSAFNAWILSKSLETLALRMERHCDNALKLATFLEKQPQVAKTLYPFLPSHPQYALAKKQMRAGGGIVTFEVKGGLEQGKRFLDALKMCSLSPNLGDTRTIATHPASTTHSKLKEEERLAVGITAGMVRISVGLEHIDDIIADIKQALVESN